MRNDEVEGQIREVVRAEGDELPLTITLEELDRRLALRRRERLNRRAGWLAAGVAVIALGSIVATTSGWFDEVPVGQSPVPSTATPASAEPTIGPSSEPTETGLPCTTIEPNPADQPPALILGATPGDSIGYGGALGAYRLGQRTSGHEGSWPAAVPSALAVIPAGPPTERLVALASNPDACLIGLVADAVPVGALDAPAFALAELSIAPTRLIEFDTPPSGDWLVRVHIAFATRDGAAAWSETFFRVLVREALATPGTLPDALPRLGEPAGTILVDFVRNADPPYTSTGDTGTTIAGQVPMRAHYQVDVVCLGAAPLYWSIGHEAGFDLLAGGDAPCNGSATTRVVELGIPTAPLDVVVDGDSGSAWQIRVTTIADAPSFIPPALRMTEAGNAEDPAGGTQAYGRCVSTAEGSDQCAGEWLVLDGARSILVPVGARLTFALGDGWQIDQARVSAAVVDQVRADAFAPEYSVGFVEEGGAEITVPVDLGRGAWIVRVSLNATRGAERFGASYDLPLVIGD